MSYTPLKKYRIMIADRDRELGSVLSKMLEHMGFDMPQVVRSGSEAMRLLEKDHYDFLITEWNTEEVGGIDLIKRIRSGNVSPQPTIPVIMLTGRAEHADVLQARDAGVNEYVVKPFSARAVYSRLERIIEKPRHFVLSKQFVGPDRRSRAKEAGTIGSERRTHQLRATAADARLLTPINLQSSAPRLWMPDYSLKAKLGTGVTLQSLITPDVLSQAQNAINAINQESLGWIKEDFQKLQKLTDQFGSGQEVIPAIADICLSISSRAGTFGYNQIARVAYMLYLFCRNHLQIDKAHHVMVVRKHVDVLFVLMSQRLSGENENASLEIINGLKALTDKFK